MRDTQLLTISLEIAIEALQKSHARTVLDCPAGEGVFTKKLLDAGLEVTAADIYPEGFKFEDIECHYCDMNDRIPFEDDQFDAVACLNGLQRIWARARAVAEMARVVKPGGKVIISFPNNADVRRRLLFMMTGSVTWNVIGPPQVALPDANDPASCFRYPMTLANVLSAVESVGLELEAILGTHTTTGAKLLSPFGLLAKSFTLVAPKEHQDRYYLQPCSTWTAMLSAFLVVIARKGG
jgi:SAM-dependent methyltransferase